jgi:1-deoxy-D-xylulose-5-phosphate synthase
MSSVLDRIASPADVKGLSAAELDDLAAELRAEMIASTSQNGGHLASSLGAVEIILACHRVLDLPHDKLVFDVGHQSYAHKLLTGRRAAFARLRKKDGVSGFTRINESPYDVHDSGHASDSLAVAAGIASARDARGGNERVVSVIGDASISGGMAMEALNYAGQHQFGRFVVILNDNEMSISHTVGAFSNYLAAIRTSRPYNTLRDRVEDTVSSTGPVGAGLVRLGERAKRSAKQLLVPGMFFEDIGFTYLGPIDGHDVGQLQESLARALEMGRPVLIHAVTRKGNGFAAAEKNPSMFHGVGPFDPQTGAVRSSASGAPSYTQVFSEALVREAQKDPRVVAVTAAMMDGTGLAGFAGRFPGRTYDVGIAEECAVGAAAGMALQGMRPVVAVYSTFLQRAYDQIATNVCLPNLPVVFAVDRAGLVGEDGSTHHGMFDLAYLRSLPHMKVAAPSNEAELAAALAAALADGGPVAVRYPRGRGVGVPVPQDVEPLPFCARTVVEAAGGPGARAAVSVLAVGRMVGVAERAAALLREAGVDVRVVDARWVKPVDAAMVEQAARSELVVTVEDGTVVGGFAAAVLESMADRGLCAQLLRLGLPDDFVGHGSTDELFCDLGLTPQGVAASVLGRLAPPQAPAGRE